MDDFVFVDADKFDNNMMAADDDVKMTSMTVETTVRNRYATTAVRVEYENRGQRATETQWGLALPEQAFITGFVLKSDGVERKGRVAEREAARQTYEAAVSRGVGAAHVATEARNANVFSTAVHVPAGGRASLTLNYEELLARQHGRYRLRLHLQHGQVLPRLHVAVTVRETRPLRDLQVSHPQLAAIRHEGDTVAHVTFSPTPDQQQQMANEGGSDNNQTQFDVEYDVERDPSGGEVLVNDGYFVHFFAPSDLKPIPKHVVFVLDVSGSMGGRKIQQLQEAMKCILSDLNPEDFFNIVKFENAVQILYSQNLMNEHANTSLPATEANVKKAQKVVDTMSAGGGTNISDALITALSLTLKGIVSSEETKHKHQPIIVFLTDGQANVGESDPQRIIQIVEQRNDNKNKAAIFALSFGHDANKDFLKELASKNSGFSRTIYEAADSSIQLQDFYKQISSPLLTNVRFKYSEKVKELTKHNFDILFNGSEFVVTGKVDKLENGFVIVEGSTLYGIDDFLPTIIPIPKKEKEEEYGNLERLWAYMTIKQLLNKKYEKTNDPITTETPEKQALQLALKYSFVTPVTSLVVVLPDQKEETDLQWGNVHVSRSFNFNQNRRFPILRGGGGPGFSQQSQQQSACFGSAAPQSMSFGCSAPMATPPSMNFYRKQKRVVESARCDGFSGQPIHNLLKSNNSSFIPIAPQNIDKFGIDDRCDIGFTSVNASTLPTPPPKLTTLKMVTNVKNHKSETEVTYKFLNKDNISRQVTLPVEIPEHAYITELFMEINGKKYDAKKKTKAEGNTYYQQVAQSGLAITRITEGKEKKKYDMMINIEAHQEATVILIYGEILRKTKEIYQLIANFNFEYIINDLEVNMNIIDSKPIQNVGIPFFKSKNGVTECKQAVVNFTNGSVQVQLKPNTAKQDEIIQAMKLNNGITGQFVIEFKTENDAPEINDNVPDILADADLIVVKQN